MKKVVVLGGGRVGSYIADQIDSRGIAKVAVIDPAERNENLSDKVFHFQMKINPDNHDAMKQLVQDADLVVNALPGHIGFKVLKKIIEYGKSCVDISFMPEDPTTLNDLAVKNGVVAVVDMGIAPGLCGVFIGHEFNNVFDTVESTIITVGGLPYYPGQGYHITFSPADIIEEYMRPARIRRHNQIINVPALSETKRFDDLWHPDLGCKLESFLTDGLRTLLHLPIPNMEERTLRYDGYANQIDTLKAMGFFDVKNMPLTSKLLESIWKPSIPIHEITMMHIVMHGLHKESAKPYRSILRLTDVTHHDNFATSMARTTGIPAVAMVENVLNNQDKEPELYDVGVLTPEEIGADGNFTKHIYATLAEANIKVEIDRTVLNDWERDE